MNRVRPHFQSEGAGGGERAGQLRKLAERGGDRRVPTRVQRHGAERGFAGPREIREFERHIGVECRSNFSHRFYMYCSGSMPAASGSTASTTAHVKSPRPSGSHVFDRDISSSGPTSRSLTIFTCGRNGSVGCSCVTTPISSVLSRTSVPTGKSPIKLMNRRSSRWLNAGSSFLPMIDLMRSLG